MRLLLVRPGPSFSVQDVCFGWRDALTCLGVNVADVNYDDRLDFYEQAHIDKSSGDGEWVKAFSHDAALRVGAHSLYSDAYTFWPDIILIVSGFFVPLEVIDTLRAHGHKIVYLFTESPYEDTEQLERAEHADLVLLNDPTNLEAFRQVTDAHYVPHAYRPDRHFPGPVPPEYRSDFAFVGTAFPSRVEFLEAVDWGDLDVILAGQWAPLTETSPLRGYVAHDLTDCIDNLQTADIYRGTRASLNLYRREASRASTAEGWSMGPREVELAACGTFFLRDPRPESDELFPMLPTFSEPAEIRPLLDWWFVHDTEREEAAAKARAAVSDRTFRANAEWFLNHLEHLGE
jgi:spore maturation protein CgeB